MHRDIGRICAVLWGMVERGWEGGGGVSKTKYQRYQDHQERDNWLKMYYTWTPSPPPD